MDFNIHGDSHSSSTTSSDPMHSWWESISKARSRIHLLSSILPSSAAADDPLSSPADSDRPGRSLLLSSAAYSSISAALSSPSSGSGVDPLCNWLYDTYLSNDHDLRLVVLSYLPLISAVYLRRTHYPAAADPVSLSGFEAVLLAIYNSETKARNGKSITISVPDISHSSLYHSPRSLIKSPNSNSKYDKPLIGVLSPPLETHMAIKSTKRASIVGIALDCYYKQISQMPSWSKLDFCKSAAIWAGHNCPCTSEFDPKPQNSVPKNGLHEDNKGFIHDIQNLEIEDDNSVEIEGEDARIPLPWELLQPVLKIIGHCLFGPLNIDEVKDSASMAVRNLYGRASHDLVPQAILATRSLFQLERRARETAKEAVSMPRTESGSNANTLTKVKNPEMLRLVSN